MKSKERSLSFIIVSAITLVLSLFVLYQTVFKQILNQEQGYFYAGIFAFILLLVFLLCNLVTKLIATGNMLQHSLGWRLVGFGILGLIAIFFLVSKLRYYYSLSAIEDSFYLSAQALADGTYSDSEFLVTESLNNPCLFLHSLFFSIVFRFFTVAFPSITEFTRVVIWTNALIFIACIILVYRITLRITDRICALITALLSAIIPCQTFIVYSYAPESVFALLFLLVLDLDIYLFMHNSGKKSQPVQPKPEDEPKDIKGMVFTGILAVLTGLLLFAEPVMLIPCILIVVMSFVSKKDGAFYLFIALAAAIVLFAGFSLIKAVQMDVGYGQVLASEAKCFNFLNDNSKEDNKKFSEVYDDFSDSLAMQDEYLSDSFQFIKESEEYNESVYTITTQSWLIIENELFYMFLLVMLCSCIIISIKEYLFYVIPLDVMFIGLVLLQFFNQNRFTQKYPFVALLIILCGVSIDYLYLNHHPDQIVVVNALDALEKTTNSNIEDDNSVNSVSGDEAEFMKRAKALIFVGNDENLYQQIKNEEHRNAIHGNGRVNVLDNTFDDFDDDYFLDEGDNESSKKKSEAAESNSVTNGFVAIDNSVSNNANETIITVSDNTQTVAETDNNDLAQSNVQNENTDYTQSNVYSQVDTISQEEAYTPTDTISQTDVYSQDGTYNQNDIYNQNNTYVQSNGYYQPSAYVQEASVENTYNKNDNYVQNSGYTPVNSFGTSNGYPQDNFYNNMPYSQNVSYEQQASNDNVTFITGNEAYNNSYYNSDSDSTISNSQELKLDMIDLGTSNTKIPENKPSKKKADKKFKFKFEKKSTVKNVENNGTVIRRVKNLSGNDDSDKAVQDYLNKRSVSAEPSTEKPVINEEPRFIPNPLPLPKKKPHVEMDYENTDVKSSGGGWDYDYEVSDDDDWDV